MPVMMMRCTGRFSAVGPAFILRIKTSGAYFHKINPWTTVAIENTVINTHACQKSNVQAAKNIGAPKMINSDGSAVISLNLIFLSMVLN